MDMSCSFCAVNYTVISTMDTFGEDYARISAKLGLGKVKTNKKMGQKKTSEKIDQ